MSTQDKVIAIIAEQAVLEPSDVTLDSTLEDLGIDSVEGLGHGFLPNTARMRPDRAPEPGPGGTPLVSNCRGLI